MLRGPGGCGGDGAEQLVWGSSSSQGMSSPNPGGVQTQAQRNPNSSTAARGTRLRGPSFRALPHLALRSLEKHLSDCRGAGERADLAKPAQL